MSNISKRIFITPLYQQGLSYAFLEALKALNSGDPLQAWDALRTFYYVSPEDCQKDVEELFVKVEKELTQEAKRHPISMIDRQVEIPMRLRNRCSGKAWIFFNDLKQSLIKRGYLQIKQKDIPLGFQRNIPTPHANSE